DWISAEPQRHLWKKLRRGQQFASSLRRLLCLQLSFHLVIQAIHATGSLEPRPWPRASRLSRKTGISAVPNSSRPSGKAKPREVLRRSRDERAFLRFGV